jgi:thiol-disulfide isomerase/thioredoxin
MPRYFFLSFCLFFYSNLSSQITVYNRFGEFESALLNHKNADTIYVLNFWATWCKPCVEELPHFEQIKLSFQGRPIKVILVSLDMKSNLEKGLIPFVNKKKIKSSVVLLADSKTNKWIDKISPEWSGALPATLFIFKNKRLFFEKSYNSSKEIENELNHFK